MGYKTVTVKDKLIAEKIAKTQTEMWQTINEQQAYENDNALTYGAIKAISYTGDIAIQIDNKYQVVTRPFGVVQAWIKGGRTTIENAAASCKSCNASKGAKELYDEWIPPLFRE